MHRVDRSKVQEILHEYKKECYFYEHEAEGHPEHDLVARDTRRLVEEILDKNFHYEFHKPVDPATAEVLDLIETYTREAVLPPVLNKLVERIVILEKRQAAGVRCMERLLKLLETEDLISA